MPSRLLQLLLALSLLLNTFVLAGFVWRGWIEPPSFDNRFPPPPPPPGGPRPSPLEMISHDLGLDTAQRQALQGLFDEYAAARRERTREIQRLREEIAAEYRKPTLDLPKLDGLVDQLTRLRAEFQKETLHVLARMEGQLTPAQRERMHEMMADRIVGPLGRGGGPGGPGGPEGGPPPPGPPGRGPGPGPAPGRPPR